LLGFWHAQWLKNGSADWLWLIETTSHARPTFIAAAQPPNNGGLKYFTLAAQ